MAKTKTSNTESSLKKNKQPRWQASDESNELIFAICDRFLSQHSQPENAQQRGAAAAIAEWLRTEKNRSDFNRERIYPLFREACRRGFLLLQAPTEQELERRLLDHFHLDEKRDTISVVNVSGDTAAKHVTATAADKIVDLIFRVAKEKKEKFPHDPEKQAVHIGMGAGYAAMLVAKRLAQKIHSGDEVPQLVLHAISAGGFLPNEPHKSPSTYFTYFDPSITNIKFVALFSATVINNDEHKSLQDNPSIRFCFDQKDDIDIVVTSLAAADHEHGLLVQYLTHLVDQGLMEPDLLKNMREAGWVGDVQFRPYSEEGPLPNACPVRAVTLFELEELVEMARSKDRNRYVVLVAGPCGECGATKKRALKPLLANEKLRLWTHLVTDVRTARELLE